MNENIERMISVMGAAGLLTMVWKAAKAICVLWVNTGILCRWGLERSEGLAKWNHS